MAATEQSMMEVIIEKKNDCEREQELFGEPTMMCLDDFQGDGQDDGQGDDQDDGHGNGQDDGQGDGHDNGQDDGQGDSHDDGQGDGQEDSQGDGQDDGQGDGPDDGQGNGQDNDADDDEDDCQAKRFRSEQSGPVHERCVHGEINKIWVPLDRSEILFRIAQPYKRVPLSRYFFRECEWPQAAQMFRAALEVEEEEFDDWSPIRSPSIRNVGV